MINLRATKKEKTILYINNLKCVFDSIREIYILDRSRYRFAGGYIYCLYTPQGETAYNTIYYTAPPAHNEKSQSTPTLHFQCDTHGPTNKSKKKKNKTK